MRPIRRRNGSLNLFLRSVVTFAHLAPFMSSYTAPRHEQPEDEPFGTRKTHPHRTSERDWLQSVSHSTISSQLILLPLLFRRCSMKEFDGPS
jgi:hypothetical protein